MKLKLRKYIPFIAIIALFTVYSAYSSNKTETERNIYKIVNKYPHDPNAFTQGLEFYNGYLYESTGLYGKSSIRKIDYKNGKVLKIHNMPNIFFGEGITILNDKMYQLTWKSKIGFVYDVNTFENIGNFKYNTYGWGLTNNGSELIYSDGTSRLFYLDPETFKITKVLTVKDKDGEEIRHLNELEYISGKIYSNIWQSDKIIIIDPETGIIEKWLNFFQLRSFISKEYKLDVLNGIAYNPENKNLYLTGKLWPVLFQINLD